MSRARDDARRNTRREFATTRPDGSPVGAYLVGYQDGCFEAFTEAGDCFRASIGPGHEPDSHTRDQWFMRGPYSHDRWDDLTFVDDYGWDEP